MSTAADLLPDFRIRFQEFVSETNERVTLYLIDALTIFSGCKTATLYLAAHLLTLDNDAGVGGSGASVDGGGGETTSETVGAESVSLMSQAERGSETFYTTTAYGRRYLALRNTCPARGFSVIVQ